MRIAAIITAAGTGSRAGGPLPKQWQLLNGRPVLAHTLRAFAHLPCYMTVHPNDEARARALIRDLDLPVQLVFGAETRAKSIRNALEALEGKGFEGVLVHDGARPLTSRNLIDRLQQALARSPAAAPALSVSDALWRGQNGQVDGPVSRSHLWRAQTPQAFHYPAILAAHRAFQGDAADDVEIALAAGIKTAIIAGDEDNLKITYPEDFARAEKILTQRQQKGCPMPFDKIRIGNGYDVHAFTKGDHVWLCGARIPHDRGLLGHSDADVGMHALTDAIYGALAEGDIGRHFPPSDPQWKGAASHIFLRHAIELARQKRYDLVNCDVTLICEQPKITPHAGEMRRILADIMGVDMDRISVKATTSEGLGFTGRKEGIAAMASACLGEMS